MNMNSVENADVNMEVPTKKIIMLRGNSGSGKTTLPICFSMSWAAEHLCSRRM